MTICVYFVKISPDQAFCVLSSAQRASVKSFLRRRKQAIHTNWPVGADAHAPKPFPLLWLLLSAQILSENGSVTCKRPGEQLYR